MLASRALTILVAANLIVIALAIVLGLIAAGKPSRYFGEGRFTTLLSCLQLLAVAFFSGRIFVARRRHASHRNSLWRAWVWAFMAAGFILLAADDAFQLHERLDHLLHRTLDLQETAWTDRLDDGIIALYGFIGLVVIWLFREEIRSFSEIRPALTAGFVCLFVSVICDMLSNNDHVATWLMDNVKLAERLTAWMAVGDGAFTLLAEGLFLAAFYLAYRAVIGPPNGETPQSARASKDSFIAVRTHHR